MVDDVSLGLTIIVGYDGSDAARRALGRVRGLRGHADRVLVVVVTRDLRSEGLQAPSAGRAFDAQRQGEEAIGCLGGCQLGSVAERVVQHAPCDVLVVA